MISQDVTYTRKVYHVELHDFGLKLVSGTYLVVEVLGLVYLVLA